jgi:hypothetical protein
LNVIFFFSFLKVLVPAFKTEGNLSSLIKSHLKNWQVFVNENLQETTVLYWIFLSHYVCLPLIKNSFKLTERVVVIAAANVFTVPFLVRRTFSKTGLWRGGIGWTYFLIEDNCKKRLLRSSSSHFWKYGTGIKNWEKKSLKSCYGGCKFALYNIKNMYRFRTLTIAVYAITSTLSEWGT